MFRKTSFRTCFSPLHAALTLVRPALVSLVPSFSCGLRGISSFASPPVVPLFRVRLLLSKDGFSVPLDSREILIALGALHGGKVLAEVTSHAALDAGTSSVAEVFSQAAPLLPMHNLYGLISQPPDTELEASLLSYLVGRDTPDMRRLEALSALVADHLTRHPMSKDSTRVPPLFHTVAHAELLRVLVSHARALAEGCSEGAPPCSTLVGELGIGKSTLLSAFALVAPSAFPSHLPVYLSTQHILDPRHALGAAPLQVLLADAAARQRLPFDSATLQPTGRRLLLLVDEYEGLYHNTDAGQMRSMLPTLQALNTLSSSPAGSSSVLLCGSTSATHRLGQGDSSHLGFRFPLAAQGVPGLASTPRPRKLRLPAMLCTATEEVAAMLAGVRAWEWWAAPRTSAATSAARLLTYFVGSNPRMVIRAACMYIDTDGFTGRRLLGMSPSKPRRVEDFVHPRTQQLMNGLRARLQGKSQRLRGLTCMADGSVNVQAIMDPTCLWEQQVPHLQWQEVREVFAQATPHTPPPLPDLLPRMLEELTDRGMLQLHFPSASASLEDAQVWPAAAAMVASESLADFDRASAVLSEAVQGIQAAAATKAVR